MELVENLYVKLKEDVINKYPKLEYSLPYEVVKREKIYTVIYENVICDEQLLYEDLKDKIYNNINEYTIWYSINLLLCVNNTITLIIQYI